MTVLCVAGIWIAEAIAQERVAPATTQLAWDPPELNEDGTPCDDLAGYVVAISEPGVDLRETGEPIGEWSAPLCPDGVCRWDLSQVDVTDGQYRLWVRAVDEAGNSSVWSDPLSLDLDATRPGAPAAVRIEVAVTVTVE